MSYSTQLKKYRILADPYIYNLKPFLLPNFEVDYFEGIPSKEQLQHADILLIRTVTKLDSTFILELPDTIQLIGTASAGFDHVDTESLYQRNIPFFTAAGSNANAVSEYIQTVLLLYSHQFDIKLEEKTIAIIGVGHTGSKTVQRCKKMGMNVIEYDPPRQKRDSSFISASIDDVLQADIISFHVPLQRDTYHYFSEKLFSNHHYDLLINASRGGVVDESFLMHSHSIGSVNHFILDVWENEPNFNYQSRDAAFIATPHIAGYSQQAKMNATSDLLIQIYRFLQIDFDYKQFQIQYESTIVTDDESMHFLSLLNQLNPILFYDYSLRAIQTNQIDERKKLFNALRTEIPFRNEFEYCMIPNHFFNNYPVLKTLY